MKILVDINHPAHVHFFKYLIQEMSKQGHDVLVTATRKDIAFQLLDAYRIEYVDLGSYGTSLGEKAFKLLWIDLKMLAVVKRFNPDYLLGIASFRCAHAAWLLHKVSYIFTDTEHATEQIMLYKPFATKIMTPACFTTSFGSRQVKYKGYHELAYLHPQRFTPNPDVLKEIGGAPDDKFFIIRFVSWEASHDIGQKGFSLEGKRTLIRLLKKYGRIIISSETPLPTEFESYRMSISPIEMHDLLYYATMYIGEGGTMASEAAVLGTPAILVNTLTAGTFQELEYRYHLLKSFGDETEFFDHVDQFVGNSNLKAEWRTKQQQLLHDTIDVTQWMLELLKI